MGAPADNEEARMESVAGKTGMGDAQPELTARQRQILELMQAGKVNKEIADKLGIGVGTVKQHIVALFKKLNVSNRAMAVSKGMSMQQGQEGRGGVTAAEGIMERRPCVVLSIALPEDADPQSVRRLHGGMAALAFDNDALFLARKGNAGDVIFGIQRVTEYDLVKALHTAQAIYSDLLALDRTLANELHGGLTAGLAGASMNRFGGWTGEAIASAAIAAARELVAEAAPGHLAVGQPARDLMQAFGIGSNREAPGMLAFAALNALRWTGERNAYGLIGRHEELAQLESALAAAKAGRGSLVYLEGETGMGKSRLCKEIAESCGLMGGEVSFFRCLPAAASDGDLFDAVKGGAHSFGEAEKLMASRVSRAPGLLIIDDFHVLPPEKQAELAASAAKAAGKGRMVILSGRRIAGDEAGHALVRLRRLPMDEVEALVREVLGERAAQVRSAGIHSIAQVAAGVPLFAVEMARHFDEDALALPLLVVICARLDGLCLDRDLLRRVARGGGRLTVASAAAAMGESVETIRQSAEMAVAAGVLALAADGGLFFTHPLLRQIIDFLGME